MKLYTGNTEVIVGVGQEYKEKYNVTIDDILSINNSGKLYKHNDIQINLPSITTFNDEIKKLNNRLTGVVINVDLSSLLEISGDNICENMFKDSSLESVDLSSLETINGSYACSNMYRNCTSLESVDLSSLETINGSYACEYMFYNCTSLESVDLSSLKTISNYAFYYAFEKTTFTTLDLSNLETVGIGGLMWFCRYNTNLTTVNLRKLRSVGASGLNRAFEYDTSLTSIDLSSLSEIAAGQTLYNMCNGCTSLQTLSFPSLNSNSFGNETQKAQMNNMLKGCTNVTLHFPSNLQTLIMSLQGATAGFGGTNTTILFDLPATS